MGIAIVTGATSGIGREFVKRLARRPSIEEIWTIGRRRERLDELSEFAKNIKSCPLDLSDLKAVEAFAQQVQSAEKPVAILVNAAGFAALGRTAEMSVQTMHDMIAVNCEAPVRLTLAILPCIAKGGAIINVCSAAAFQPLQGLNLYAATKAFLLAFSRALRWESFGQRLHITAVCPDWVKTEFISVAKQQGSSRSVRHFPLKVPAGAVVTQALLANRLGLPVSTCGPALFHRIAAKFIPHELIMGAWELLRRI